MDPEVLMTSAQVAMRLNVSRETVHRMCRSKKWPHVKIGRLYRFTEAQYQEIITPPQDSPPPVRDQRQRIGQMLAALPPSRIEAAMECGPRGG